MKNLNLLVIVLLFMAACQSNSTSYQISGNIVGLDSGAVYLVKAQAGQAVEVDTAFVENGQFIFKGEASAIELHYLRLNERDYFARFFLENEKIKVETTKDSLTASTVTGSPETDVFNVYVDEIERLTKQFRDYQQAYSTAVRSGNQQEVDRISIDRDVALENMNVYAKNFVRENSTSVVAPFIVLTQLVQQIEYVDLKKLVDLFPVELDSCVYAVELKKIMEQKAVTAIGVQAPDFTMNDTEDKPVALSSFKGNYLLIDFWASWCVPCRQENPNVVRMYNEFHEKGFNILGVSLDQTKDAWLKAIEDDGLIWSHVSDLKYWKNEVARMYGVKGIPHTILLDPDGKIVANNLRGEELENKLKEIYQ